MLDPKTKRRDVPEQYTWNLADIFASDEAWRAEYDALRALPAEIAAYRGRLGASAAELLAWFRLGDETELRCAALANYAMRKADQDQGDGLYQDMNGKAMSVIVAVSGAAAFAAPEIMAIPDETLDGFFRAEPALEEYRRSLYQIRRRRAHRGQSPPSFTASHTGMVSIWYRMAPPWHDSGPGRIQCPQRGREGCGPEG